MRKSLLAPIAVIVGVAIALGAVGVFAMNTPATNRSASPKTILTVNSTLHVLADNSNGTSPTGRCWSAPNCLVAGVSTFEFNISVSSHLQGKLSSTGPVQLIFTSGDQIPNIQCDYEFLLCNNGTRGADPGHLYYAPSNSTNSTAFNLGLAQFNFTGPNNDIPPGTWVLYLVNWTPMNETLTVTQSIAAIPD